MPSFQTLQRLLLAVVFVLSTGVASAGSTPPPSSPSSENDEDTDAIVMVVLGLVVGTLVNCASDTPLMPGVCSVLGWENQE